MHEVIKLEMQENSVSAGSQQIKTKYLQRTEVKHQST